MTVHGAKPATVEAPAAKPLNLDAAAAAADELFAQMQTPAAKDGARAAVDAVRALGGAAFRRDRSR